MDFINLKVINIVLYGIITLLAFLMVYLILHFVVRKKDINETITNINNRLSGNEENFDPTGLKNTKKGKKKKNVPQEPLDPNVFPAHVLLGFDRICNDMIIKNDVSLYSMVIQCRGINLDLMSDEEKAIIQRSFVDFLNNVTFPFQFHVQTRVLDFNSSISSYMQREKNFEDDLKLLVDRFNQLQLNKNQNRQEISETAKKILRKQKLYEYSKDLYKSIEKISKNSYIMQSSYYISISCSSSELGIRNKGKDNASLSLAYEELFNRCQMIITALQNCGVEAVIMNSHQLVHLIYSTLMQEEENSYKLREMLESGLIRLYTASR